MYRIDINISRSVSPCQLDPFQVIDAHQFVQLKFVDRISGQGVGFNDDHVAVTSQCVTANVPQLRKLFNPWYFAVFRVISCMIKFFAQD